jgi:hypothetical protein
MAAQKTAQKAAKKGSKLASLKSAIFGATNKKKAAPAAPARSSGAKAVASPASSKKDMKAAAADKKAHSSAPSAASNGKSAATAKKAAPAAALVPVKAAAPAALPKGGPAALHKGKKGAKGKKAAALTPQERMAGPSIRITYDANGEAVCREVACEGLATSVGYCRMHYIKNWKKIKRKEVILKEGKLNQYIEELVAKYPDKYIEAIRQDLANDKDFAKVIYDLDLDESVDDFDVEGESLDSIVGDIKRDFDDEGESGF